MSNQLVVTRHKALLEYLRKHKLIDDDAEHISFADESDVKDKDVFGVLPLRLACHARSLTELMLRLPPDIRGKDLPIEDIEFFAKGLRTYTIREVTK